MIIIRYRILIVMFFFSALIFSTTASGNENSTKAATAITPTFEISNEKNGGPFVNVTGLAFSATGKLYAACGKEDAVIVFDKSHKQISKFGQGIIGNKHGLRIFGNELWVTDIQDHLVMKFDLDGKLLQTLGERSVAAEDETHFNKPTDVAIAPSGDIYISDGYGNSRIVCLDKTGKFKFAWGKKGSAPGEFVMPHNIICGPQGRVYIADRGNSRIQVFTPDGKFLQEKATPGNSFSLSFDLGGNILASATKGNEWHGLILYTPDLKELGRYGEFGSGPGQFKIPHGIARNPLDGKLVIGDAGDQRIQFFPKDSLTINK